MVTLSDFFKVASANIEPDRADIDNASAAHEAVRGILESDEYFKSMGIDTRLIGSYGRHVSIKRIKDADVFSMLTANTASLTSVGLLDDLEGVLADEYGDRVERQARSIMVDFPEFELSVDAVPARPSGDHWEIPSASGLWEETNPLKLGEITTTLNDQHKLGTQGMYVPTVKVVRQIRRSLGIEKPSGLYFEIATLHAFSTGVGAGSRAEYLTIAVERVADILQAALVSGLPDPTLPGRTIQTSATMTQLSEVSGLVTKAALAARDAFDDTEDCSSARKWRQLLGKGPSGEYIFPMPAHCNDDGTRKFSSIVPGAARVPAGHDRFA